MRRVSRSAITKAPGSDVCGNADLGHSSSICHGSTAAHRLTCTDFPVNDLGLRWPSIHSYADQRWRRSALMNSSYTHYGEFLHRDLNNGVPGRGLSLSRAMPCSPPPPPF